MEKKRFPKECTPLILLPSQFLTVKLTQAFLSKLKERWGNGWREDTSGSENIHTLKTDWDFLAAQWLRFHTSISGGTGLIPGQGTKIPQTVQHSSKARKWESRLQIPRPSLLYRERQFALLLGRPGRILQENVSSPPPFQGDCGFGAQMSLKKPEPLLLSSQAERLLHTPDPSSTTVIVNSPGYCPGLLASWGQVLCPCCSLFTMPEQPQAFTKYLPHKWPDSFLPLGFCSNPLPTSHQSDITAQPDFQLTND